MLRKTIVVRPDEVAAARLQMLIDEKRGRKVSEAVRRIAEATPDGDDD